MSDPTASMSDQLARLETLAVPSDDGQTIEPPQLSQQDYRDVQDVLDAGGFLPIQQRLDEELEAMGDRVEQAPVRRIRSGGVSSIVDIQTPTVQADASWYDGEVFAEENDFRPGDFFLGRSAESGNPLGHDDDAHVFMACKSRSGKGVGVILPNHMLWEGPLISVDPKGENATVTAARRGQGNDYCVGMGQTVRVLDPMGKAHVEDRYRARFNPFDELDPDDPECVPKSAALAEALCVKTGDDKIDYWAKASKGMLHAYILHIVSAPYYKGRRNLGLLRDLIMNGEHEAWERAPEPKPDPTTGKRTAKPDAFMMLFCLMMRNPAFNGEVRGAGRALATMYKSQNKGQWTGISDGMRVYTQWLLDPRMREAVSETTAGWRLSDIKSDPNGVSVYLCLPERNADTYGSWQRCFLNLIAYELMDSRAMPAVGQSVLMSLDEFAGLGKLPMFERGIAYFAGYRVKLFAVLQNFTQIKDLYGENWQAFLGNSSAKIFFDLGDPFTSETLSKFLGEIELIRQAETFGVQVSQQRNLTASKGRGTQQGENDQLTLGEGSGENESTGENEGEALTEGDSWGTNSSSSENISSDRNKWLPRGLQQSIWLLRRNEKNSKQTANGQSRGGNRSKAVNRSRQKNKGTSRQKNVSLTKGKNRGHSEQVNIAASQGEGVALNASKQQQFQKRPLVDARELRSWFQKISDPDHPYFPGLALVILGENDPAIIKRVRYFEDDFFDGCWDEDPDYPETKPQPVLRSMDISLPLPPGKGLLWAGGHDPIVGRWFKAVGDRIEEGEPLFEIKPGITQANKVDRRIPVPAPVSGTLERIDCPEGVVFDPALTLGALQFHLGDLAE